MTAASQKAEQPAGQLLTLETHGNYHRILSLISFLKMYLMRHTKNMDLGFTLPGGVLWLGSGFNIN